MSAIIRTERTGDYSAVSKVVEDAFRAGEMEFADEHLLVERLRLSMSFIPDNLRWFFIEIEEKLKYFLKFPLSPEPFTLKVVTT